MFKLQHFIAIAILFSISFKSVNDIGDINIKYSVRSNSTLKASTVGRAWIIGRNVSTNT